MLKNIEFIDLLKNYDTIIPVPISKKRYKQRGYNQSSLIAKKLAKELLKENFKIKYNDDCLFKTKNVIEQSKLNKDNREKNIKGAYEIFHINQLKNKKILLVDDIYTTGSTLRECSKILKKSNPKKIGVLTIAKD